MKKNLLGWFAMATMLVGTGCSSDEVVNDYSPENAIQFGTYVGRDVEGRVAPTTIEILKQDGWGFGVYAHYQKGGGGSGLTPNFINNQFVKWNSSNSAWEYSPVKYWPNNADDQVTFWAYAPWKNDNTNTSATVPSFEVSDGTDYVAAQPVTAKKTTVDDVDDKVVFNFQHMMSKVGFKVEAIIDELEHGSSDNGKDDEGDDNTTDTSNKGFNTSETAIVVTGVTLKGNLYEEGIFEWNNINGWVLKEQSEQELKEHTLTATAANFANPTDNTYEDDGSGNVKTLYGQLAKEDKEELNNNNSFLMLVPQSVGINITVNYSVITRDESLDTKYSRVDNIISSGDFNFTFESGKAYNFVLHIGLTSVKFDAQVTGWENAKDVIVNVPLNISDND